MVEHWEVVSELGGVNRDKWTLTGAVTQLFLVIYLYGGVT